MSVNHATRRTFLKATAGTVAAGAVPYLFTSSALAANAPSDQIGIGAIGVGGRGTRLGNEIAKVGNMLACADVDESHRTAFASQNPGCAAHEDYRHVLDRKDIDVVTIGTPDHWHAKIAIDALRAGKDVYCEKPMTLTIEEGQQICKVARETDRVFQVGTLQRSSPLFLKAIAIAQSGRLGGPLKLTCSLGPGHTSNPFPTSSAPAGLNWDMWLGQAVPVDFTKQRCHGNFRYWLEYSGGKMTDWGAHHIDISQWLIGCQETGPTDIVPTGGNIPIIPEDFDFPAFFAGDAKLPNCYNTAVDFHVDLKFANGSTIHVQEGEESNGILIEGPDGRIFVNRRRLTGKPVEELTAADHERLDGEVQKLYKGKSVTTHVKNFMECVRDRGEPVADPYTNHRCLSSVHLANIALMLQRPLKWDPAAEKFVGDDQAAALISRPQREPYAIKV